MHAEATGWDGLWLADHLMPFTGDEAEPMHEAWSLLAGLAAAVPRIRLGPLVTGNTYRNPALLAKIATTVDHISGGRAVLGLGAGWQENEHRAYSFDFGTVKSRIDRFDEACQLIQSLLHSDRTDFSGEHYTLVDAPLSPKPVQHHMPLVIGAQGEKRTMRIAAQYADEWNCWAEPDLMRRKMAVLDRHCDDVGNDPGSIERSAAALLFLSEDEKWLDDIRSQDIDRAKIIGTPKQLVDVVAEYVEAGVDELIIPDWTLGSMERKLATMDQFISEVAIAFS